MGSPEILQAKSVWYVWYESSLRSNGTFESLNRLLQRHLHRISRPHDPDRIPVAFSGVATQSLPPLRQS
ncbi:hypothetical protein TWF225_010720 [Orbilia oligospora]|nr:hypothetical protein TWF225_010720 [Orbilia oligospora]